VRHILPAGRHIRVLAGLGLDGRALHTDAGVLIYLIRNDPALLERRMRLREKESEQSLLIRFSWIWFLLTFLVPGFDHRFGWSHVPTAVVIAAMRWSSWATAYSSGS